MPTSPAERLLDLVAAHRTTAVLHAAVQLGLPQRLANGAATISALAAAAAANEPALLRLMRALVALGICDADADRFALTRVGRYLVPGEGSLLPWVRFEGAMLARSWAGLAESVRSGKTASELAGATDRFALLANDPAAAQMFNDAMVSLTSIVVPAVLASLDLSGVRSIVDVGGGFGELLVAILKAHPWVHGSVLDLAYCAEGARRLFETAGVADRASFVEGSFLDAVPGGADAHVLKSVLHNWDDERAAVVLRVCRSALAPGGRVFVVERLLAEEPADDPATLSSILSDLNMLRGPGGLERTENDYRALIEGAGFDSLAVTRAGRFNVLAAVAA